MICDEPRYYERYNETGKIIKSDALGGTQFLGRAGGGGQNKVGLAAQRKLSELQKNPDN